MKNVIYPVVIGFCGFLFFMLSCDKRDGFNPCDPEIVENMAIVDLFGIDSSDKSNKKYSYNIENPGNSQDGEHGIVYGSISLPDLVKNGDSIIFGGNLMKKGLVEISIQNESIFKKYYTRAYAMNCVDTTYSIVIAPQNSSQQGYSLNDTTQFVEDGNNDWCIDDKEDLYYSFSLVNTSNTNNVKIVVTSADSRVKNIMPAIITVEKLGAGVPMRIVSGTTPEGEDYSFKFQLNEINNLKPIRFTYTIADNTGNQVSINDTLTIPVQILELVLGKVESSGNSNIIEPGDDVNFELLLKNESNIDAHDIRVELNLDSKVNKYVYPSDRIFNVATLAAHGEVTLSGRIKLEDSIQDGDMIDLTAMIKERCDYSFSDFPWMLTVGAIELEVDACIVKDKVQAGGSTEMTITIVNNGSAGATDVTVEVDVSKISDQSIVVVGASNIAVGDTEEYKATLSVKTGTAAGDYTLPISVKMNNHKVLSGSCNITVLPEDAPALEFVGTPELLNDTEPNPCETVTYRYTVMNTGTADAEDVEIELISKKSEIDSVKFSRMMLSNLAPMLKDTFEVTFDIGENAIAKTTIAEALKVSVNCSNCTTEDEDTLELKLGDIPELDIVIGGINDGDNLYSGKATDFELTVSHRPDSKRNANELLIKFEVDVNSNITIIPMTDWEVGNLNNGFTDKKTFTFELSDDQKFDTKANLKITITDAKGYKEEKFVELNLNGTIACSDGLLAYYTFDSENADDEINNFDGINNGVNFSSYTNSEEGYSAYFDLGKDVDITLPRSLKKSFFEAGYTISLWLSTNFIHAETLFSSGGGKDIRFVQGKVEAINGPVLNEKLCDKIGDGLWHMFTIVYSMEDRRNYFYVDGMEQGSVSSSSSIWGSEIIKIGKSHNTIKNHYDGYMDNIRFHNKALDDTCIRDIYDSEGPKREKTAYYNEVAVPNGLVSYYDFDSVSIGKNALGNWEDDLDAVDFSVGIGTNTKDGTICASFNGDGYLIVNAPVLGQMDCFSLSFWTKGFKIEGNTIFRGAYDGADGLYVQGNSLRLGSVEFTNVAGDIFNNTWNHVVVTSDKFNGKGDFTLYINDTRMGSSPNKNTSLINQKIYYVGKHVNRGEGFIGLLDNFRLYSRELDEIEVGKIFDSERK